MKPIRLFWDFFFGVLLIGGAPMSVVAVTIILGNAWQSTFKTTTSGGFDGAIFSAMFIISIVALVYAVRFRLVHRLIPHDFVIVEVVLGIVGALALLIYYGLHIYFIIA